MKLVAPSIEDSGLAAASLSERARRATAPLVALLACSLGLCCFVSLARVLGSLDAMVALDDRFVGWVGAASMLSLLVGAVVVFLSGRAGSGPALALSVASALVGLALAAADPVSSTQLALSLLVLGVGSGGLVAGSLCMAMELPPGWARPTLFAWSLSMVGAWPMLAWFSRHTGASNEAAVTVHPAGWLVAVVAAVVTTWSVATLVLDPPRLSTSSALGLPWQDAWLVLGLACSVALLMVMLLGFDSGIGASWLRPVVLVTAGLVGSGWVWITTLIPSPVARAAFVASGLVAVTLPTIAQLLLVVADAGEQRVSGWWLVVMVAGTIAGAAIGWRFAVAFVIPYGLLLYAVAAAGAWVVPAEPWAMALVSVLLLAVAAAVLVAGVHTCAESRVALSFVGFSTFAASLLGLVFVSPFSWALSGDLAQLSTSVDEVRAMTRVLLGLTFSASVLASAYTWILSSRTHVPTRP